MLKLVKKGSLVKAKSIVSDEEIIGYVINDPTPKEIAIKTNDGKVKVIDTLTFVVTVLPLIDTLLDWIIKKWNQFFKSKK
jgi:penicillin V acylase-like amidase (Ntn superfamily)